MPDWATGTGKHWSLIANYQLLANTYNLGVTLSALGNGKRTLNGFLTTKLWPSSANRQCQWRHKLVLFRFIELRHAFSE